jgi:hypothetical protein
VVSRDARGHCAPNRENAKTPGDVAHVLQLRGPRVLAEAVRPESFQKRKVADDRIWLPMSGDAPQSPPRLFVRSRENVCRHAAIVLNPSTDHRVRFMKRFAPIATLFLGQWLWNKATRWGTPDLGGTGMPRKGATGSIGRKPSRNFLMPRRLKPARRRKRLKFLQAPSHKPKQRAGRRPNLRRADASDSRRRYGELRNIDRVSAGSGASADWLGQLRRRRVHVSTRGSMGSPMLVARRADN